MSLLPTKAYPDVLEGYDGAGQFEVYVVQKYHGQRTLRISMPKPAFIRMAHADRHSWLESARRRASRGAWR